MNAVWSVSVNSEFSADILGLRVRGRYAAWRRDPFARFPGFDFDEAEWLFCLATWSSCDLELVQLSI